MAWVNRHALCVGRSRSNHPRGVFEAMEVLTLATDPRWVDIALGDLDAVLLDHAHCEKKAAAAAMALVSHYPDHGDLVKRLSKLAQEELRHFYQVHEHILRRGLRLGRDAGDPYVQALRKHVRAGSIAMRRLDQLLVCALVEARSCERLRLLGEALSQTEDEAGLGPFYRGLAIAEAGHFRLFVDLAARYDDADVVEARLQVLAAAEAEVMRAQPLLPRIH